MANVWRIPMGLTRSSRARRRATLTTLGLAGILSLTACDGSSSTPAPTPTPVPTPTPAPPNSPPSFTSATSVSVAESTNASRIVYQAAASDPEGTALTYAIAGGDDAARFAITAAGALTFVAGPNFEAPADADRNNQYNVRITASDGQATTSLDLVVIVTNFHEDAYLLRLCDASSCEPKYRAETAAIQEAASGTLSIFVGLTASSAVPGGAIIPASVWRGGGPTFASLSDVGFVGDRRLISIAPLPPIAGVRGDAFLALYANTAGDLILAEVPQSGAGPQIERLHILHRQFDNNYGGWVDVGPDGNIYVATGDGGGTGDPLNTAQDSASLLGKVLRISPDFASVTVIAKGFRNPNGGFFHNNMLVLADRGENLAEEINLIPLDGTVRNYGWPYKDGTTVVRNGGPAGMIDPIAECRHDAAPRACKKIVGGVVFAGANPSLQGAYIFGDRSVNGQPGALITLPASRLVFGQPTMQASDFEWRSDDMFAYSPGTLGLPDPSHLMQRRGTLYMTNFYPGYAGGIKSEVWYLGCQFGC